LGTYELVDEDEDDVWDAGVFTPCVMDAFGNVLQGDHGGFHLTTKQYDTDVELYYFPLRWYDPGEGRFVSVDPLPSERRTCPYAYARSSSLNLVDISGGCTQMNRDTAEMLGGYLLEFGVHLTVDEIMKMTTYDIGAKAGAVIGGRCANGSNPPCTHAEKIACCFKGGCDRAYLEESSTVTAMWEVYKGCMSACMAAQDDSFDKNEDRPI